MKRLAIAMVLVCALSVTALAGEIPSTDVRTAQPTSPVVTVLLAVINLLPR